METFSALMFVCLLACLFVCWLDGLSIVSLRFVDGNKAQTI